MEAFARRQSIMRLLYRHRHMTISALAKELDVSERTVRRDIEELSLTEPIYTQTGRYDGGVYISKDYTADKFVYTKKEMRVIEKMLSFSKRGIVCNLDSDEITIIEHLLTDHTKATVNF